MPSDIPGVSMDSEGVCNYCRNHARIVNSIGPLSDKKQKHLNEILNKYRGRKPFDSIIGLSGGKDSTFLLYLAVKKYGMHPLVYNFDNGYRSQDAINNIEKTVNKLGVDLIVVKPNPRIIHQLQKIFLTKAGEFCTPCLMHIDGIWERLGRCYGIKLGISGSDESLSTAIEGISIASYYDRDYFINAIGKELPISTIKTFIKKPHLTKAFGRVLGTEPVKINLLENIRYNILEMETILKEELHWSAPGGEIEHGDCLLDHLKDYLVYQKYGVSEHTQLLSMLIRKGEMSREIALQQAMCEERRTPPDILFRFLNDIDMTPEEFELAKKRHFSEIPNIRSKAYFKIAEKMVSRSLKYLKRV